MSNVNMNLVIDLVNIFCLIIDSHRRIVGSVINLLSQVNLMGVPACYSFQNCQAKL